MSNELEPSFAAKLADDTYLLQDELGKRALLNNYKNIMEIADEPLKGAKTGAFMILKKSKLAAIFSQGKGVYRGQAFMAFRGTSDLYDALTDLNTGVKISHTRCMVHQGFHYAFDSVLDELRDFIANLHGIHTIHCVGHSLGGAIATLAADWIKMSSASAGVKLYTFGSPRVGLDVFSRKCTSRLLDQNIYRVYHRTDPVPMVPTWPFFHVPSTASDYGIWSPVGVPWEYHRMIHYIESTEKAGSWANIEKNRPQQVLDSTVENWLQSDGVLSLTANTLELLNAALVYVMKKAVNAVGILMVGAFASTFTFLDRMAMILAKAAELSSEAGSWVARLVRKMASLVGIVLGSGISFTVAVIRAVFLMLHRRVSDLVLKAGKDL